uniref:Helix-turn-helix domain-containing protein n=1 Tax=Prevotella sp. GTC17253 TaxID=3236793 RepID=A0AB33IQ86_9BACT
MESKRLEEITIKSIKELYQGSHIADDILLIDNLEHIPFPNEPRRMHCLFMALCSRGVAHYTIDTVAHTVQTDDILIVSEGQVANNYVLSDDFKATAIVLSYDFFYEIVASIRDLSYLYLFARNHPVFGLQHKEAQILYNYFQILKRKVDNKAHQFRRETTKSLLTTMIYDISNVIYHLHTSSNPRQPRANEIFNDFIILVEQHYRKKRRVSWYSDQMNITPKYLSEVIKQVSHRTPNEWIDQYVTLELRVQLKHTMKSIKEIAEEMNFTNQSFFGKYFKEHVGMSPTEYRKS